MNWHAIAVGVGVTVIGLLLINKRALAAASKPSKKPVGPVPSASKQPQAMNPTPQPSSLAYQTLLGNTTEKYGRGTLASGKAFTLAPLWDTFNNTWARSDYNAAEKILASHGLRMPTFDELDEIASRPDTLITALCNQPPTPQMATKAWWDKFDLCIQGELDKAGWNGSTPVMFGKAWALGADTAHSWLHGFYQPKGQQPGGGYSGIIQNRGKTKHDRSHVDYSQLLYGVEA